MIWDGVMSVEPAKTGEMEDVCTKDDGKSQLWVWWHLFVEALLVA